MNTIPKTVRPVATGLTGRPAALQWWRESQLQFLDESQATNLRAVLIRIAFMECPDWRLAIEGDAARAVRIALHVAASYPQRLWAIDYAASALLLCAGGNPAAEVTLAYMRRRFIALCTRMEV
ncbi:MAG: hypothetical protein Q7T81_14635 [Pseudolabrys sp.]|nr:hypothetical protein [Pseudolabrys sp.]